MSEIAEIQKKVKAINEQLQADIKKKRNSMIVSIIGGIILMIIVLFYFSWIKGMIKEVIQPEGLMMMAGGKVKSLLPQLSKDMEEQLKAQAPTIAKYSSEQVLLAIPEGRVFLEKEFIMKTEEAMDQFIGEFDKVVTEALEENRTVIVGFMRDASNPAKKDELTNDIYKSLKEQFNQDYIKEDIDSYTKVLNRLNGKIKHLYEGVDLTEEEMIVRDIIFALRELAKRGGKVSLE
jgi:hypoxanthine-guanine phosphoribosyltransferase